MTPESLSGALSFIQQAGQLKDTLRSGYSIQGRRESTAEHTWRLCLMAMVFERELGDIDFAKLLKICVLHDLGEAISGDIPAVAEFDGQDKSDQERRDLQTLLAPLDTSLQAEFFALWEEYESAASPEARLVKGLDKIETLITHNQGKNPDNFDYAFNLHYGLAYTQTPELLKSLRALVDADTKAHVTHRQRQATGEISAD